MLLTHVLEDENPLGRVAAIVSLQEEILRLKDKCEEAAITQQESEEELQNLRSKHANTVSELVKQRSVNSDLQEKLSLLEGLL
jgi:predicted nuclease with TOPRIM domain